MSIHNYKTPIISSSQHNNFAKNHEGYWSHPLIEDPIEVLPGIFHWFMNSVKRIFLWTYKLSLERKLDAKFLNLLKAKKIFTKVTMFQQGGKSIPVASLIGLSVKQF